jgi:DNA polymerase-1
LSETYLHYTPVPITALIGTEKDDLFSQSTMADVAAEDARKVADYAAEDADVTWQLAAKLRPEMAPHGQTRVFDTIESPLLPVLTSMENFGVKIDVQALREYGVELDKKAAELQKRIQESAGGPFNLNSPKQLGEVLFDRLKLIEKPKKTATGQYQTNEQVLQSLTGLHPIIQDILDYREVTKLNNTYVEALPHAVSKVTGRVHTTFHQLMAATGRMASSNPNLQNIPIRSDLGREIRKAFVPGFDGWVLMSADYSQIELRVMAALSGDKAMIEAFAQGLDIHAATAARVYGVELDGVLPEMRRTAKMVNFGIIYGISAFGLSQRLGIPRGEAATIIENYFKQFPGVKRFMEQIVEDAKTPRLRRNPHRPPPHHPRHQPAPTPPSAAGRARRHEHPDPRHRRRHDQARHDPRRHRLETSRPPNPHAPPSPRRTPLRNARERSRSGACNHSRCDEERATARRRARRSRSGHGLELAPGALNRHEHQNQTTPRSSDQTRRAGRRRGS